MPEHEDGGGSDGPGEDTQDYQKGKSLNSEINQLQIYCKWVEEKPYFIFILGFSYAASICNICLAMLCA